LEQVREGQAERWAGRFADLLDEDPGIEAELRALVEEVAAHLPAVAVSAADHSVAAGRDVPRGTRARPDGRRPATLLPALGTADRLGICPAGLLPVIRSSG